MSAATQLTARQQEIWQFLVDYVDRHGYPPTVREIGEAVGLASPSTVHAHLANLERAGLLRRDPTKPRALDLIGHRRESRGFDENREEPAREPELPKLPLLGQIAAGSPLLAEENIEDELAVPEPLGRRADFLLRVKGESMINAGILDGDILVVQRAQDARDGEIVVALVGDDEFADEATVKTFYREGNRVRLQPENDSLEPIYADFVQILGTVTGSLQDPLMTVAFLNRTLDQELAAIARGASFECLVCGEFLLERPVAHACLECGTLLCDGLEVPQSELEFVAQAG